MPVSGRHFQGVRHRPHHRRAAGAGGVGAGAEHHPNPQQEQGGAEQYEHGSDDGELPHDMSPQRVVQLRQAQQVTGVVGWGADREHRELHLVGGID